MSYIRPARIDEIAKWLEQFDFLSPDERELVAARLFNWSDVIIQSQTAS